MKELANVVAEKQEKLGAIKLMYMYRNNEKMLADALGAIEEITILNYHHSVPYKYQGRIQPQSILSSAHSLISFSPKELPLKPIKTQEELKAFLESTDKALLLLEFCGWAPKLLKGKNNGTGDAFGGQGVSTFGTGFLFFFILHMVLNISLTEMKLKPISFRMHFIANFPSLFGV